VAAQDIYACAPANLPFDAIAPRLRKGVTQVGYGGPFVLRSNPIGGLIDTVRGFCFPVPMMDDGSGLYQDLSGQGLDSAGISGGFGGGAIQPNDPLSAPMGDMMSPATMMCGPGQAYDAVTMTCQPSAMVDMGLANKIPGGPEDLDAAKNKVIAFQMGQGSWQDCETFITTMQFYRPIAPGYLKSQWTDLINATKAVCANAKKRKQTGPSQAVMALSGQANRANLGPMPMTPTPLSLTEGNVRMVPSRDPMGGAVDPRASIPPPSRGQRVTASRPSLFSFLRR
jgi:hypothetical protein